MNDLPHQADGSERAGGDHASLRIDPDSAERLTAFTDEKVGGSSPSERP